MQIENEASFLAAIANDMNLFAGAGFSTEAFSGDSRLPVGGQLATELRTEFNKDALEMLDLAKLHTVINATNPQELESFLRNRFTVTKFDKKYAAIPRTRFKSIFTTNIDNLFQNLYTGNSSKFLNDVYKRGSSSNTREAVDLIQLHGSVDDDERPFTFNTLDLAAAANIDPDRWNFLRQRMTQFPTLYWGYSMSDSGTLETLRAPSGPSTTLGEAWIQVRPASVESGIIDYYRALNLQIIVADTVELLDYLASTPTQSAEIRFADPEIGNVPSATEVLSRPIEDFFRGSAPHWSDIFSDTVTCLSAYRTVANNVAAGQSTILAGIHACGKSTLLMQSAALINFAGPKLIYKGLDAPRAKMLREQIGAGRALVFIDDFASDVDAFNILQSLPNVTVVAADRDYNISTAIHLIDTKKISVLAVSEVSEQDIAKVWKSIPARMRRRVRKNPQTSRGIRPTVSEFVRNNIQGGSLDDRIVEYLAAMRERDPDQSDMVLLACYMHRSGAPLSMDVAIAFFRDRITNFDLLYKMLKVVGEVLHEHENEAVDQDQDYFSARSMALAENVIKGVKGSALRGMLVKFHTEVSPLRISSYDTFKRKGYDSRLFERAFSDWRAGNDLYEMIYARTQNHFVLQQKALFLSARGNYPHAFRDIELARGEHRGKPNWSIENSYNVILFRSNVNKIEFDVEALQICNRALRGLETCFDQDRRKGRHALSYAGLALSLARDLDASEAVDNLQTAEEMLRKAQAMEPWFTNIGHTIKDVNSRIIELS